MSIASGFTKMKNYILTSSGYKLLSRWTSSQTVHMGDGTDDTDTVEYRFGAMKGVTSSLATDNDEFALSASAGKNLQDQCTQLNQSLGTVTSFDIKSGYSIRELSARRTFKICTINIRIRKDDGFGTGFVEMANIIGKDNYPAMPSSFPCSIVTTDSGRCLGSGEVQINTDGKIKVRASDSTKNIAYSEASINAIWICP